MADLKTLRRLRGFAVTTGSKGRGEIVDGNGRVFDRFSTVANAVAALANLGGQPMEWTPTDRDYATLQKARALMAAQIEQRRDQV